ncbi:MAG: putative phospholipid ABC transporter-binding protein MlaD [Syntrophorhabdaceae bacterium PtaU1.Bin034]|nr:MAG: putative phospholipid ABC transporter-binding protein MlaD [Syntrophorhabdaceae bacterium PtaU1.Bin034]
MTTEFKVGIVVLLGIAILFYMSFRVGRFGVFAQGGYTLTAHFKNTAGLDNKSPVEIAGVEVGRVTKITLDRNMAKTSMLLKEEVKVPIDSKIAIKSFGILGDKYLEIIPGQSTVVAKNGDELANVVAYADYDEIFQNVSTAAKNFGETVQEFKGLIGEQEKENLKQSLANIKVASGDFKEMVSQNKGNVTRIVTNVAEASVKLGPMADKADATLTRINTIVEDVGEGKGTLGMLVKDDKLYNDAKEMVASLKSVSADIEQGKGTLGKLVKDESLYMEAKETMKNVNQFTGELKDGKLVGEAQKTMKKIQQAAEGVQEQTPIAILGTIFGLFF